MGLELLAVCANGIASRGGGLVVFCLGKLEPAVLCFWPGFVSVVSVDRVALILLDLVRL